MVEAELLLVVHGIRIKKTPVPNFSAREFSVLSDFKGIGAASRTRTEDRLITNQMLYQLS